ncbi:MAG: RusA family crossover junction endodeoxyribonuclease [bacterium]|nr:RusA family crossover junction endodeoxyribonuclease [bacterium]
MNINLGPLLYQCEVRFAPKPVQSAKVRLLPISKRCPVCKQSKSRPVVYQPRDVEAYKKDMAVCLGVSHRGDPIDEPLFVHIVLHVERPKSAKKRPYPMTKPDLDNYVKPVMDALEQGQVIANDSRIVARLEEKVYAEEMPKVVVRIYGMPT